MTNKPLPKLTATTPSDRKPHTLSALAFDANFYDPWGRQYLETMSYSLLFTTLYRYLSDAFGLDQDDYFLPRLMLVAASVCLTYQYFFRNGYSLVAHIFSYARSKERKINHSKISE